MPRRKIQTPPPEVLAARGVRYNPDTNLLEPLWLTPGDPVWVIGYGEAVLCLNALVHPDIHDISHILVRVRQENMATEVFLTSVIPYRQGVEQSRSKKRGYFICNQRVRMYCETIDECRCAQVYAQYIQKDSEHSRWLKEQIGPEPDWLRPRPMLDEQPMTLRTPPPAY